jgi:TRAP-type C4-dicarboxylate transport system permease small subunit
MGNKTESVTWFLSLIEKLSLFFGYISGGFVLFMMFSIGYDVVMRHIFNAATIWADEVSGYLLVGIAFLGAAYTFKVDGHIRIEALMERLQAKTRQRLEFVTDALSIAFLVVFTWQACRLVKDSYVRVNLAPTLVRTPLYLPQLLLAIGLAWLCLQLLAHIVQRAIDLRARNGLRQRAVENDKQRKEGN